MYADRHNRPSGLNPTSLGIAVAINGTLIAALLASHPMTTVVPPKPPLRIIDVAIPPIPPEVPPPPKPVERQHPLDQPINAPTPRVMLPQADDHVTTTIDLPPPQPLPSATGTGSVPAATPTPAPVTIGAEIDPAHRGDLQPTYPPSELRAEREGVVTVRVLVGVDGRVHTVEQVSATSDAFFRATESQALRRWRFRPATRGGIPIEAWRQMTIRFVIPR